jgi:hypothetical protein
VGRLGWKLGGCDTWQKWEKTGDFACFPTKTAENLWKSAVFH